MQTNPTTNDSTFTVEPLIALMNYGKVKHYLPENAELNFYIMIEEVKPFDELTEDNVFIRVTDLLKYIPTGKLRFIQCQATTYLINKRFTHKVNSFITSKISLTGAGE